MSNEVTIQNNESSLNFYGNGNQEDVWRVCCNISSSSLVPQEYQGKPENCFIAIMQAKQLNIDALSFMRQSYLIHGKIGMLGKFVMGLINQSGLLKKRLWWTTQKNQQGEIISCTCFGHFKDEDEPREYTLTWKEVELNGWLVRDKTGGPTKWEKMRQKMFHYRTAAWWADLYAPEITGGIPTKEALEDEGAREVEAEVIEDEIPKFSKDNLFPGAEKTGSVNKNTENVKKTTKNVQKQPKIVENEVKSEKADIVITEVKETVVETIPIEAVPVEKAPQKYLSNVPKVSDFSPDELQ